VRQRRCALEKECAPLLFAGHVCPRCARIWEARVCCDCVCGWGGAHAGCGGSLSPLSGGGPRSIDRGQCEHRQRHHWPWMSHRIVSSLQGVPDAGSMRPSHLARSRKTGRAGIDPSHPARSGKNGGGSRCAVQMWGFCDQTVPVTERTNGNGFQTAKFTTA